MTRNGTRKDGKPWEPMWNAWRPTDEAWLREHAGTMPRTELASHISEEFGVPRSVHAVRVRAARLGVSLWSKGLSMREVTTLFGVDHRMVVEWWIKPGLLHVKRWAGRGPSRGYWFEMRDLEAFVREYPWAYDYRRMRPASKLRMLAEVVQRREPWVGVHDLARYMGREERSIRSAIAHGLVPHQRRYGAGGQGRVCIKASDLPAIADAIVQTRHKNISRAASESSHKKPQCQTGYKWGSLAA